MNGDFDLVILTYVSVYIGLSSLQKKENIPFIISWLYPSTPTKYYAPPPMKGNSDSWFKFLNQLKVKKQTNN